MLSSTALLGGLPDQRIRIDFEKVCLAVVDIGVEEGSVDKADLGANRALALVGFEIEFDLIAGLDAVLDPVLAPLALFLRAELDDRRIAFVLNIEFPAFPSRKRRAESGKGGSYAEK
jgi:hypothetical protein